MTADMPAGGKMRGAEGDVDVGRGIDAPGIDFGGWHPIASAPRDREIIVYAPPYDGLQGMASMCQWHPDAGFCIDELRKPTHWCDKP